MTDRVGIDVHAEDIKPGDRITIKHVVREVIAAPEPYPMDGVDYVRVRLQPMPGMPGYRYYLPRNYVRVSRPVVAKGK